MEEDKWVGWIGTGVMGLAMCSHLVDAGHKLLVYNRTTAKAMPLCSKGAVLAESIRDLAARCSIVFVMVGYPHEAKETIMGIEGILSSLKPNGIVVDMSTNDPVIAQEIYEAAKVKGCQAVDAPVSGGDKGAKAGSLAIMAGGEEAVVERLIPYFSLMGHATYMGNAGSGQSCKLANQITVAANTLGLVEGMLYAHKSGLDLSAYLRAIAGGAAGSKILELYAGRIQKRDFSPGGFVSYLVKDLGIALEECRRSGLSLPGLALAQQLYVSLVAHGEENLGAQALIKTLERLNNLELPKTSGWDSL